MRDLLEKLLSEIRARVLGDGRAKLDNTLRTFERMQQKVIEAQEALELETRENKETLNTAWQEYLAIEDRINKENREITDALIRADKVRKNLEAFVA